MLSLKETPLKLLVHSFVFSKLNYCPVVWGELDKTLIVKFQQAVNVAGRVIFDARKYDNVTPEETEVVDCREHVECSHGLLHVQGCK